VALAASKVAGGPVEPRSFGMSALRRPPHAREFRGPAGPAEGCVLACV